MKKQSIQKYEKMKQPAVYIVTNQRNGTLYVGVTSHLVKRIYTHKEVIIEDFTQNIVVKYLCFMNDTNLCYLPYQEKSK